MIARAEWVPGNQGTQEDESSNHEGTLLPGQGPISINDRQQDFYTPFYYQLFPQKIWTGLSPITSSWIALNNEEAITPETEGMAPSSGWAFFDAWSQLVEKNLDPQKIDPAQTSFGVTASQNLYQYLLNAGYQIDSRPVITEDLPTYREALQESFTEPNRASPLFVHLNLDPLSFSSVNTSDWILPDYYDDVKDQIKAVPAFNRLLKAIESGTLSQALEAISALATEMYKSLPKRRQREVAQTYQTILQMAQQHRHYQDRPATWAYRIKVMDRLAKLTWDNQPLFKAVADHVRDRKGDLMYDWSKILYETRIAHVNDLFSKPDGQMPKALQWSPPLPFHTQEQWDYYNLLVVSSENPLSLLPLPLPVKPWPQRDENGVLLSNSEAKTGTDMSVGSLTADDRLKVVRSLRTALEQQIEPGLGQLEAQYNTEFMPHRVSEAFWTLAEYSSLNDIELQVEVGDHLDRNPQRKSLLRLAEQQVKSLLELKAAESLEVVSLVSASAWVSVESKLTNPQLKVPEVKLAEDRSNEGEHSISKMESRTAHNLVTLLSGAIHQFIFSPAKPAPSFMGFLSLTARDLERAVAKYFSDSDYGLQGIQESIDRIWKIAAAYIQEVFFNGKQAFAAVVNDLVTDVSLREVLISRYEFIQGIFEDISGENLHHPILTRNLDNAVIDFEQVLQLAEVHLTHSKNPQESFRSWGSYYGALSGQLFNPSENASFSSQLADAMQSLVEFKMDAEGFSLQVDPLLADLKTAGDWSLVQGFIDRWINKLEVKEENSPLGTLEDQVLHYLPPHLAVRAINRIRFGLYYLQLRLKEAEIHRDPFYRIQDEDKDQDIDIDDVILNDVNRWAESLPSGWPTSKGFSIKYQQVDRYLKPNEAYHLTREAFTAYLMGHAPQEYAANETESTDLSISRCLYALIGFLTDFSQSYYRFFSLLNIVRDQTDHPIKGILDHDVLNRLLLVLIHVSEAASSQLKNLDPSDLKRNHLEKVKSIVDGTRYALGAFLDKMVSEYPQINYIARDYYTDHFQNMTSVRLDTAFPKQSFTPEEEALAKARTQVFRAYEWPASLFDAAIEEYRFGHAYIHGRYNRDQMLLPPPRSLILHEDILKVLAPLNPSKVDEISYPDWFLETANLPETEYFLGRLAERLNHPFTQGTLERYEDLTARIYGLPLDTLRAIVGYCEGETDLESIDAAAQNLALQLTPPEQLWVSGFVQSQIRTTERNHDSYDLGDPLYEEAARQKEADTYLFSLTDEEAKVLGVRLMELYGPDALKNDSQEKLRWLQTLDQPKVRMLVNLIQAHLLNPDVLSARKERLRFRENLEDILKNNPYAALYAYTWLSYQANSLPSKEEVQVLKQRILLEISQEQEALTLEGIFDQIEHLGANRTRIDLLLMLRQSKNYARDQYQILCHQLLREGNEDSNRRNQALGPRFDFWIWFNQTLDETQNNFSVSQTAALVAAMDEKLAVALDDSSQEKPEPLDQRSYDAIRMTLEGVITALEEGLKKGGKNLEPKVETVRALNRALFEPYHIDDLHDQKTHSRYNPYGYSSFDAIFSLSNFDRVRRSKGYHTLTDPILIQHISGILKDLGHFIDQYILANDHGDIQLTQSNKLAWSDKKALKVVAEIYPELTENIDFSLFIEEPAGQELIRSLYKQGYAEAKVYLKILN